MNAKLIIASLRVPFFTGIIVPIALGSILAWYHTGDFYWGYFILTMVGSLALHAGANTINDYFDHFRIRRFPIAQINNFGPFPTDQRLGHLDKLFMILLGCVLCPGSVNLFNYQAAIKIGINGEIHAE